MAKLFWDRLLTHLDKIKRSSEPLDLYYITSREVGGDNGDDKPTDNDLEILFDQLNLSDYFRPDLLRNYGFYAANTREEYIEMFSGVAGTPPYLEFQHAEAKSYKDKD